MKKTILATILFTCVASYFVYASDVIKGPLPEKLPPPEKCSVCHNIPQTYKELLQSAHKDLKCLNCHVPGAIQRIKYESKDCSFYRLGYHDKDGNWIEIAGNEVCLRCHAAKGIKNTTQKCWSCHMTQDGVDKIRILKDKKAPPTPDNIREIKEVPHKSHIFKKHLRSGIDQIVRLAREPAQGLIVQHAHDILPPVRETLRAFAVQPSRPRRYCLIDGRDSLRLLRAYDLYDWAVELPREA